MAQSPPGFPGFSLPPPTWPYRPSLPPPTWYNKPPSSDSSQGRTVAGTFGGLVACLLVGIAVCSLCRRHRNSRARAAAAPPQNLTERESSGVRVDVRQLHQASAASPTTAGLPAFTYSPSVKRNVTGGGEEAATCSVCLGALQLGDTVRLLPACLHLYHAECIDPWLDAHSTCPVCRSDTDPTAV